ncbi:hypothetical protein [Ornithinimicrobium cavernae]|uniref:hypothetical protein n=1 Tax=Ornithinimicrobium cavernae TaxID=2666047 RepID=UPI000D6929AB|nr:hypothetical protein [Ornithinimicrobium cavernae]
MASTSPHVPTLAVPAAYVQPEPVTLAAEPAGELAARDANQGVAVDDTHAYAINNRSITKIDRSTGERVLQFVGDPEGPIQHLDSGVVVRGTIYAAHSNYPEWPMESSIEVFDARTLEHLDSHPIGIDRGSLTWLDFHDGSWWAGFANYDNVHDGRVYGENPNAQIVRMDDSFQVEAGYVVPRPILDRFAPMSNSGGSWGPDGNLYLTGHDLPEAYVMQLPMAGAELEWLATVELPGIEGQGIAWDRPSKGQGKDPHLFGIDRPSREIKEFDMPLDGAVPEPVPAQWTVRSADEISG